MDVLKKSAGDILRIKEDQPELLFSAADAVEAEYKVLMKHWHPDVNHHGDATNVFAHIGVLHRAAQAKAKLGEWHVPGLLELHSTTGKTYRIKYRVEKTFELGRLYIGDKYIVYCVEPKFKKLYDNALKHLKAERKYPSPKLETEIARYLPRLKIDFETASALVVVFEKTPDLFSLRDVHEFYGKKMDPRHVAWICNRLFSFCCWTQWRDLTHNDLSMDTIFISPPHHGMTVFGGWWYATAKDQKLIGATQRTMNLMPSVVKKDKLASTRLDLELVRGLARELLGDPAGSRLIKDNIAPAPMARWLTLPTTGVASKDYKSWNAEALKPSFGEPKFHKMIVSETDIYPERN